jgi:hypothetical protein
MTLSRFDKKNRIKKIRKRRFTFFNKINKLGMIGANIYVIIKINDKYFIYNSRSDEEWPSSDIQFIY